MTRPLPTVSECLANGWGLMVTCRACRVGRYLEGELPDVPLDVLRPKLRCSRCGQKDSAVSAYRQIVGKHETIVAVCRIGGESVGDLMRAAGVSEGGKGTK